MTPANQLLEVLAILRRQWRQRLLLESVVWIAGAALLAVVASQLITTLFGVGPATVLIIRALAYALIVVAIVRWMIVPVLRRASDEQFALYVEERAPTLRQSLLSAVHELHAPESERASLSLTARLIERALIVVRPLHRGAVLERARMIRALRWLGAIAIGAALLFAIGPVALRHTARLLFAPWSVAEAATMTLGVRVLPGNAVIPRGAAVDVHASLVGFTAERAEVVTRTDSATEWVRVPMSRDSIAGAFTARVFDLMQATEYFVDANGVRSPTYRLTVSNLPAVHRLDLDLRYPTYTRLPDAHIADGGDVAALVGTTVTVRATITKPVRGGALTFGDGTAVALALATDGRMTASFRVRATSFYRIDLIALDGAQVPGAVQYAVEALPDHSPTVFIEAPGRDTKVTSVDEVRIAVRASDDYGVEMLELRYRVNGGEEKRVVLTDSTGRRSKEPRAAHTLFLEELKLSPGDLVAYHAVARDGAGNAGASDVYFLEIRPFGKNYRQSEQQGSGSGGGAQTPEFVQRQRDVVASTFNWLRDSATTATRKRKEDIATIHIAEARLRDDVTGLVQRLRARGAARTDTLFVLIQAELEDAAKAMQAAEERLVKGQGREAFPSEQQALRRLQRAEALYREVQVQMGDNGGGGGGGGSQKAEDLADLFELQTDKLRNQYEAVRQQSQQSADRQVDATLERLKQLANRQQQENERMQRMADAMREKLGREANGGSGGGGSQRELARQAEEQARRLERLAREQSSPEMAQAAQRLQQAVDAMRKAASGSLAQGSAAVEQLRNAARGLEGIRSANLSDGVRKLAENAQQLQDRQRAIAASVKELESMSAEQRAEQIQRLGAKKDALAREVDKLETDADRAAREGRREQPGVSSKLGEAADAIRDQRVRDKIALSKDVVRVGSPEYANTFEAEIGENLRDVADKMRAASGALGSGSASRGQERALDRVRELVRGMESLRQRVGDGTGGNARQRSREFGLRRENAQALRSELIQQGVNVADLDKAIEELRRLENGRAVGDPRGLDELQAEVIEGLKTVEFSLYRKMGLGSEKSPILGAREPVPEEYRAAIEEYYRSLAGARRTP